ncbi:MAG: GNAT family N-acetyltransferase [Dehalococcoidales bacterium]|nr:GNAT family N-acetyltransferase [Dehalococcoidales bacterium]
MITFSILTEDRWEEYRDLRLEALQEEPLAYTHSRDEEQVLPETHWRNGIKNVMFALADGKPVGMAGIFRSGYRKNNHIYEMWGVYVRKEYRGQGAGLKLIEATVAEIKSRENARVIEVGVSETQKAAQHLYEKCGFEAVGHFKKYMCVDGKFYDALLMEKYL